MNRLRPVIASALLLFLTACSSVVMDPPGDVALQQRDLLVQSTALMLLIIVPVMVLIVLFAWRYRQSSGARYEPNWSHSTHLELVIWAAPLLIIICLGALTWIGTHLLDPYRALDRIAPGQPVTDETPPPIQVNVVALDWKWLFIYPEYGIATVNEMAVPVNRPISMRITASSVMNSLYIPALAGQVYAMPGMETRLHGVLNEPGVSTGFSANYSGAGFSGMRLRLRGLEPAQFEQWLQDVKAGNDTLTREGYLVLAQPSEAEPIRHYARVDATLYRAILNRCVEPGTVCMDHMMAMDSQPRAARPSSFHTAGAVGSQHPAGAVGSHHTAAAASASQAPHAVNHTVPEPPRTANHGTH